MDPMEAAQANPEESGDPISRDPIHNLRSMIGRGQRAPSTSRSSLGLWRGAAILSIFVNLLFLLLIFAIGKRLFSLKTEIAEPLLENVAAFVNQMEAGKIETEVYLHGQVPVAFDLALQQDTIITLAEETRITGASLSIRSATFSIDAPSTITLPAGSQLPVTLNLSVPVNTTAPVELVVPVSFSLADSEITPSLEALQKMIEPYRALAEQAPNCWQGLLWGGKCPSPPD